MDDQVVINSEETPPDLQMPCHGHQAPVAVSPCRYSISSGSPISLYNIVDEITSKGCAVEFVSERITVDKSGASPLEGLMLGILAAFAEFERRRIRERQAERIALAKARGKCVQAPKLSNADVEQVKAMIQMGIPKAEVARTFGVSRQTLYTALRRAAS